ncbi:MAG: putative RNA binding protein [Streblomastix strix]|uniref:Putative RNA binding protein n=1 Tax=Streblomastix strix TaxID=222440 RepID=A0A5J4UIY4_9EUKA|nr:MAG: putative RNA binding protein [Streblomastix strix]
METRNSAVRKKARKDKGGVIYLSRVPRGFEEQEMKVFFTQFGKVTRLNLARSEKTGRTKHFAFVEFANEDVARKAAEAMNDYIIYEHIMKCKFIENEFVKPSMFHHKQFIGSHVTARRIAQAKLTKKRTTAQDLKRKSRLLKRQIKREKKLSVPKISTLDNKKKAKKAPKPAVPKISTMNNKKKAKKAPKPAVPKKNVVKKK